MALRAVPNLKRMTEMERLRIPAYVIWKQLGLVFMLDRETKKLKTREEREAYRDGEVRKAFERLAEAVKEASLEQTAREYVSDTRLYYRFLIEQYCPFVRRQPEGTNISLLEEIDTFLPWSDKWKAYEKEVRKKEATTLKMFCEHI